MIDDATSRLLARFYPAGTVETHMDLLGRWLRRHGRPLALYTDRHSIFEPQDKGQALPDAVTQFGRALQELGIELIRAHSPQAKGRVERSFGTAQDRWVKELRLAGRDDRRAEPTRCWGGCCPAHNRRFSKAGSAGERCAPAAGAGARPGGDPEHPGGAGGGQRLHGALPEPLLPAAAAGLPGRAGRQGGDRTASGWEYGDPLSGHVPEVPAKCRRGAALGALPPDPRSLRALAADASGGREGPGLPMREPGPLAYSRPAGARVALLRSPILPTARRRIPSKEPHRPAEDHPWRKPFKRQK